MALSDFDTSIESGKPVYLYKFVLGEREWRFNSSANEVMTLDGKLWVAAAISHSELRQNGDASAESLTIQCPTTIAPVQLYMLTPPSNSVLITIFQKDAQDDEFIVIYSGEVSQVNPSEPAMSVMTCETISSTLRRRGLRIGWQRSCPYPLYDELTCKVSKTAHGVAGTIGSINGFNIEFSGVSLPDRFAGGFIEWTHPVKGLEFRAVEEQSGNTLRMFGTTIDLYAGLAITVYPGCDRSPTSCQSFNNYDNYGGAPLMPGKSPFDGDPVFY